MGDGGSVFANLMQESEEITIYDRGKCYLGVRSSYLQRLGWENNRGDTRTHGYERNWFRNVQAGTRNYFWHLHLICLYHRETDRLGAGAHQDQGRD